MSVGVRAHKRRLMFQIFGVSIQVSLVVVMVVEAFVVVLVSSFGRTRLGPCAIFLGKRFVCPS